MLKKQITYEDYNGETRTETFHFNLTRAEVTEMELSTAGGLEKMLKKIVEEKDGQKIIEMFKTIILKAYGEKSEDGRRFVKSKELSEAFSQTPAYDILFMELATSAEAATVFINGIVPQKV